MSHTKKISYWRMPWGTISIEGKDAKDYLQRMSTANLKLLDTGHTTHAAFLTAKGTTIGLGWLRRVAESNYLFLLPLTHSDTVAAHLEQFHFGEALQITDKSKEYVLFGILGKAADWPDAVVPDLAWALVPQGEAESFEKKLIEAGGELDALAWSRLRVRYGIPESGKELTGHEILLEANFDRAVARNKGCYPGQEVIERIFTYGSVNKKLLPVVVETNASLPALPVEFSIDGKWAGSLVTLEPHAANAQRAAGLAYLHKSHWESTAPFDLGNGAKLTLRGNE